MMLMKRMNSKKLLIMHFVILKSVIQEIVRIKLLKGEKERKLHELTKRIAKL